MQSDFPFYSLFYNYDFHKCGKAQSNDEERQSSNRKPSIPEELWLSLEEIKFIYWRSWHSTLIGLSKSLWSSHMKLFSLCSHVLFGRVQNVNYLSTFCSSMEVSQIKILIQEQKAEMKTQLFIGSFWLTQEKIKWQKFIHFSSGRKQEPSKQGIKDITVVCGYILIVLFHICIILCWRITISYLWVQYVRNLWENNLLLTTFSISIPKFRDVTEIGDQDFLEHCSMDSLISLKHLFLKLL